MNSTTVVLASVVGRPSANCPWPRRNNSSRCNPTFDSSQMTTKVPFELWSTRTNLSCRFFDPRVMARGLAVGDDDVRGGVASERDGVRMGLVDRSLMACVQQTQPRKADLGTLRQVVVVVDRPPRHDDGRTCRSWGRQRAVSLRRASRDTFGSRA